MASRGKVLMAMSGGVDSTVAALRLIEEGYDVTGITMHLFCADPDAVTRGATCCSLDDVNDARAACAKMGIEHYVLNFTDVFEDKVVQRFCDAYRAGKTPNPCIDCNRFLKFEMLQRRRRELGCDYVATGHYARRVQNEDGSFSLLRGRDANKDQAYVLYHLTQDTLAHMLFPLGDIDKSQTRALAAQAGLRVAEKPESQDICFVPDGDYAAFIEKHDGCAFEPGPVYNMAGELLGTHCGLGRYTIGQRKGLNLGGGSGDPLYVVGKRVEDNSLIVGAAVDLEVFEVSATDVTFINESDASLLEGEWVSVEAKTSYRQTSREAQAHLQDGILTVRFSSPVRAVSAGQSLVIYDGDRVMGGGTIEGA